MSKVLIVYGSTTGKTAALAEMLGAQLTRAGHSVTVLDAANVTASGLCDGYDAVLFGCSAWGTDDVELQDDFQELFDNFDELAIKDVKTACFATGDSTFTHFCGAVDVIEGRLRELGSRQIAEGLRIDGEVTGNEDEIQAWAANVARAL